VYGDDIILPTSNFSAAQAVLEKAGFAVNSAKTFSTSWFRESCGQDAFRGCSVTPVYIRRTLASVSDVVHFHNEVRRFFLQGPCGSQRDCRLLRKWRDIHPFLLGPQGFGDGHYHVDLDEATPSRAPHWIDAWQFRTVVPRFASSLWGFDRSPGIIPDELAAATVCAALGPKHLSHMNEAFVDRKRRKFRTIRTLGHSWPSGCWF
jgi:hypothetical protein